MTSKRSAMGADNFRLIKSISRAIESRLHEAGILTYASLASLKPHAVSAILGDLNGVTTKRIIKENWLEQARGLSCRPESTGADRETTSQENRPSTKSKGLTSFVVELLLDEEGQTKRTTVFDVATGGEETWKGWQERPLLDFIVARAELRRPVSETQMPTATTAGQRPEVKTIPEAVPADMVETGPTPALVPPIETQPQAIEIATSTGKSAFQKSTAIPAQAKTAPRVLFANQAFEVHLALDRSEIGSPTLRHLNYQANIYAKSLKGRLHQSVGEAGGQLGPMDTDAIIINGSPLPQGLYRLHAIVDLSDAATQPKHRASAIFQTGEKLMRIV